MGSNLKHYPGATLTEKMAAFGSHVRKFCQ
jgi:hypothetical protein